MRLTLRTLLAYLDDVLDPADKEALGKKIESSEFAEDLVHRTKDTMRRLRLSAPQVVGTGMGLDPNSVAEYLDNVMPPESVGDFERICLESDMHLAEVASCHHVLTMVLGQPADIDPAAKQRMYTIPTEVAERKQMRVERRMRRRRGQPIVAPLPVARGTGGCSRRRRPRHAEIPEYLRPRGWARFRGLLLGLAAMLLVAATLYFFGGLNRWFASDGCGGDCAARWRSTSMCRRRIRCRPADHCADSVAAGDAIAEPPLTTAPPAKGPTTLTSPATRDRAVRRLASPRNGTAPPVTAAAEPQRQSGSGTTRLARALVPDRAPYEYVAADTGDPESAPQSARNPTTNRRLRMRCQTRMPRGDCAGRDLNGAIRPTCPRRPGCMVEVVRMARCAVGEIPPAGATWLRRRRRRSRRWNRRRRRSLSWERIGAERRFCCGTTMRREPGCAWRRGARS